MPFRSGLSADEEKSGRAIKTIYFPLQERDTGKDFHFMYRKWYLEVVKGREFKVLGRRLWDRGCGLITSAQARAKSNVHLNKSLFIGSPLPSIASTGREYIMRVIFTW